jgi:hypothetical protein
VTVASPVVFGAADPRFSLEYQVARGDWRRAVLPVCCCERFEDALPVRQFHLGAAPLEGRTHAGDVSSLIA